jgi:Helix-turn-helix domain
VTERPYTAREAAEKLGICTDTLYRDYARLVAEDGMPPRLRSHGRYAFHRGAFDAWLARTARYRAMTAANDVFPLAPSIEQERTALAAYYAAQR